MTKNLSSKFFIILLRQIYALLGLMRLLSSFHPWHFSIVNCFKNEILRKKIFRYTKKLYIFLLYLKCIVYVNNVSKQTRGRLIMVVPYINC